MADVTVVIPVGPYHASLARRAIASCEAQTVPVTVLVVPDRNSRGPAFARNYGLARVDTEYVVFLDADDELAPTFVERCLSAYDGTRYIYTDWLQGDERKEAPDCPWTNRTWHCITTLLPTAWARDVGGFNEHTEAEDTDFYLKLVTNGRCGKRLAEPLFVYGKEGRRAKAFVESAQYALVMKRFTDHYGGKVMSCCGDGPNLDTAPAGDKQPGDVLAQATWGGNRTERGRITGRMYPRTGNGKQVWVDPRDVDAAPQNWRRVETPIPTRLPVPQPVIGPKASVTVLEPELEPVEGAQGVGDWLVSQPTPTELRDIAAAMVGSVKPPPPQPVEPVAVRPDVSRARELRQRAANPPLPLSDQEVEALKAGHELEITEQGTKVKRKHAPDTTLKATGNG